jgi:MinD-like ATPase involved in chromosome partitioning or flagellar assembly
MSKVIVVWGCPDSGKTTFTAKLSKMLYDKYGKKIICVFVDSATPTLPVLFPNKRASHINSIGAVLSRPEITKEAVLKSIVTTKEARNIGFVGYTDGENRYSYPEFSENKAAAFYDTAASLADFVIVDCGNKLTGLLALTAIGRASHIFRLCKPDLKAISFFSSQAPLYGDAKYRMAEQKAVLNVQEQDLYMPVEEAAQHFKCGKLIIPYAPEIKAQTMNGQFFDKVANKAWGKAMKKITHLAAGDNNEV